MNRVETIKKSITARLQVGLPSHCHYHSLDHTLDVLEAATRNARLEGLTEKELELVQVAALYHDCGYLENANGHEAIACGYVRMELPELHFQPDEIELICGMIMATRYPQQPVNRLDAILCDADLDYLGRTDFFLTADKLRKELLETGKTYSAREWNALQVDFLTSHRYFTVSAQQHRNAKKAEHLSQVKSLIDRSMQ